MKYSVKVVILAIVTILATTIGMNLFQKRAVECSWAELRTNLQKYENKSITIQGYISPLLGGTHNYIYLTCVPYCKELKISEDIKNVENCIPVYFSSTEITKYSGKLITVTGELSLNNYVDTNGYSSNFRLWGSELKDKAEYPAGEKFNEFKVLVDSGLYDDLLMYKSMYDAVLFNVTESIEVEDSKFDDMIIYLASEGITPSEELTKIINIEKEISNELSEGNDIRESYIRLGEYLDNYFRGLEVM